MFSAGLHHEYWLEENCRVRLHGVFAEYNTEPLFENHGSANTIKLLTKLLYAFGAIAAVDEFGRGQGMRLSEHLYLKVD